MHDLFTAAIASAEHSIGSFMPFFLRPGTDDYETTESASDNLRIFGLAWLANGPGALAALSEFCPAMDAY